MIRLTYPDNVLALMHHAVCVVNGNVYCRRDHEVLLARVLGRPVRSHEDLERESNEHRDAQHPFRETTRPKELLASKYGLGDPI
jgi:hypothetical protein